MDDEQCIKQLTEKLAESERLRNFASNRIALLCDYCAKLEKQLEEKEDINL